VISARGIGRRFGDKRVLREIDLELPDGGFLLITGANGSGKTTLLRIAAGLARPSEGELHVGVERDRIGYLAHDPLVYRELTALENLELYGKLYRVPERRERIGMLLERFGLWDARRERVGAYSRGMQQRLALCRALLHDPALLIFDEPYTALDAQGAELLDAQLRELRDRKTFLVSTHDPERIRPFATSALSL
jgi:ABC-type multidrug transport system ATPase subunit